MIHKLGKQLHVKQYSLLTFGAVSLPCPMTDILPRCVGLTNGRAVYKTKGTFTPLIID